MDLKKLKQMEDLVIEASESLALANDSLGKTMKVSEDKIIRAGSLRIRIALWRDTRGIWTSLEKRIATLETETAKMEQMIATGMSPEMAQKVNLKI